MTVSEMGLPLIWIWLTIARNSSSLIALLLVGCDGGMIRPAWMRFQPAA
jgi:hypothetical protein